MYTIGVICGFLSAISGVSFACNRPFLGVILFLCAMVLWFGRNYFGE